MNSEASAQTILDRLNTSIVTCDLDLHITSINPAAESMFGLSQNQAVGRPLPALLQPSHDNLSAPAEIARSSQQPVTAHDVSLKLPHEPEIKVDFTITPFEEAGLGQLVIELFQVDGFLEIARDQNRVDQYDASRDVLRGLAHEVKNPLGGLRGAAQLLERQLPDRAMKEYTRIIIHESDRLSNLVDRMMGSYAPMDPSPVNVHEVLEHVRKLALVEVQQGVDIERDYDPSLPEIFGDKDQLIQAVLNIMRNSLEAMDRRGSITLRTRVERSVQIRQQRHRWVIKIDIEDDGPGIPPHLQERIFYPMVTGSATGSGLGLSIAQDIVNKHKGVIQLKSEPGCTCFSLLLPLTAPERPDE